VRVSVEELAFHPRKAAVAKGKSITWTNDDSVEHDVIKTSGPGKSFKSGPPGGIAPEQTYEATFRTPGRIIYQCRVHPGMEGTIIVR
jgi:plastocyanin